MAIAREPGAEFSTVLDELNDMGKDARRRPFLTRTLRAIEEVASTLPGPALNTAVSASSDLEVLLTALLSKEVLARLSGSDPLAGAKLRGLEARVSLMAQEGGMWTVQQVADHLGGISRQAIDKRLRLGKLLAIETGRHGRQLPVWQFTEGGVLPRMEEVLAALEGHDPWSMLAFFLSPNVITEGKRPLDLLRSGGNVEPVLRAARLHGEQAAV